LCEPMISTAPVGAPVGAERAGRLLAANFDGFHSEGSLRAPALRDRWDLNETLMVADWD
jgi:hypothetical protein